MSRGRVEKVRLPEDQYDRPLPAEPGAPIFTPGDVEVLRPDGERLTLSTAGHWCVPVVPFTLPTIAGTLDQLRADHARLYPDHPPESQADCIGCITIIRDRDALASQFAEREAAHRALSAEPVAWTYKCGHCGSPLDDKGWPLPAEPVAPTRYDDFGVRMEEEPALIAAELAPPARGRRVRPVPDRAALAATPPALDVERLAQAIGRHRNDATRNLPIVRATSHLCRHECAPAIAREYAALAPSTDTPEDQA